MADKKLLLLESTAQGEGQGWRKGQHLIDALPYIDDLPPETKRKVELMIEEEKRRSATGPAEYAKELPPIPGFSFPPNSVLAAEFRRVLQKQPMEALDTARYRLDPPPQNRRNDLSAWKHALENAQSQLEHQNLRILNLELLLKYGPNIWRAQNQLVDTLHKSAEKQLADTKRKMDHLNKERKLQQTTLGIELRKLEEEWAQLVRKNIDIHEACTTLEKEVASLEHQTQANSKNAEEDGVNHESIVSQEAKGQIPNGLSSVHEANTDSL